jgi:hypothetical protein
VKYHSVRTQLDGYTFDSKAEAKRYAELRLLEKAGEIQHLTVHPRYPLVVDGTTICTYIADFSYLSQGHSFIEDVKGVKTPAYRIKKKLFETLHPGLVIEEVKVR